MLIIEQTLRKIQKDWLKFAEQDHKASKIPNDSEGYTSWMAGRSSAYQECARTLQLWLDDGGR